MARPRHSILALLFVVPALAHADPPAASEDKTLSPYFVVEGAAPGIEAMPLESTNADVHISGVIADVVVTQVYRNDGDRTINARYVFPASTRAAVYGMKMTIGDRTIVAKIKEREAAKAEYDEAKKEGKTASLLEEDRPNVFSMSVANILPKDRIAVELRYTELLVPTDGTYELVYPTVVGPRYASETTATGRAAAAPENQFVATPYTHAGTAPGYHTGIRVELAAGMTIASIDSPSHRIATHWTAKHDGATVELDGADDTAGNRDFVLHYQLAGKDIAQGMLAFPGAKENFFVMMVQPPHRPAPDAIPPREYVFIIDVSGSMEGFPLDTAKALMTDLLGRLRPTDKFDVLLFSGADQLWKPESVAATPSAVAEAVAYVGAERGGGGTELLPAIQHAMTLPRPSTGESRSFVVITDGYIAEEPAVFDQIRDHLGEANVFAFGIGSSVNRHLMEGVAKAGQGEAFIVADPSQAPAAAEKFRSYIEAPVLTNVKLAFDGFDAYDVQPAVLPDVFAERPVVVIGKYRGTPSGKVTLTGVSGHGRFVSTLDASTVVPDAKQSALSYLWARTKISELSDFYREDVNHDAVVKLGLDYNLLTKFTSFIAVEQLVRTTAGSTDVDQPLPMPAGVSDSAVAMSTGGMAIGAEPPLPVVLAVLALALVAIRVRRRRLA